MKTRLLYKILYIMLDILTLGGLYIAGDLTVNTLALFKKVDFIYKYISCGISNILIKIYFNLHNHRLQHHFA